MGKLAKSSYDKKIAGVCGGLARHFGWDATTIRLLFVIAAVFGMGSPVIIYLILMFVMPRD